MNREQARQTIRSEWRSIIVGLLQPAKQNVNGEKSYICPFCPHGTHGDGLTVNKRSKDGNTLKCFGCGWSGDIIDLYKQTTGTDYNTTLSLLADQIGITIDPYNIAAEAQKRPQDARKPFNANLPENAQKTAGNGTETPTADYTEYYKECANRINEPAAISYLAARGISLATAAAYKIGFDNAADPANAPGGIGEIRHPAARLIIPTSNAHYVGRSVDPSTPKKYSKMNPSREKGAGAAGIFNYNVLYAQDVQTVFVTEGVFNALSIIEAGAAAIATNSASNVNLLLEKLSIIPTKATLVLAFDNDPAGIRAQETLKAGLSRLNISYIVADEDITGRGGETKEDANDLLIKDRDSFAAAVHKAQMRTASRPDSVNFYIDNLMGADLARFKSEIKSGYANLDEKAGGLYSGLYVIAAISSLGKTTFSSQMADQIAAAGHDVLFFSMEQSRLELVSKSISRKVYQSNSKTKVNSLQIQRGYLTKDVLQAADRYKQEVQDRISIIEGNFNCNISFIGDYIRDYIRKNNVRPVVFVDYLQVLQPEQQNGRQQTTKETVDTTITELKRMSRELDLTVIVISSVNRANYLMPIDFESLKETGSIEYTADVVWGLQLQCINDDLFNDEKKKKEKRARIKAAKAANPRKIELVCLKNRYGIASYSAYFDYYPANDYFTECEQLDFEQDDSSKAKRRRF